MSFWCKWTGHRWKGCQCGRCGQTRDQGHAYAVLEGRCAHVCAVCGKEEPLSHQWNHCTCAHCGEQRDEAHDWMHLSECEQVCRLCGQERSNHQWQPLERGLDRCRYCGKTHRLTAREIARRDEEWENNYE